MLIAEDLLLLLTRDDTGRLVASGAEVDLALGGALLVELALMGRIDVTGPGDSFRGGRLVVRDPQPTGDPQLDEALAIIDAKQGKKPQNVVARLRKGQRVRLYTRLVERGLLRAEEGRVLGIFPSHRWPAQDANHEASVHADLVTALRESRTSDPRTAALVSLLLALRAVHKVVEPTSVGLRKAELTDSATQIAEGDWAGKAVRKAIDSARAAIIAASSAAAAGGSGS